MTTLNLCVLAALVCVGCAGADGADGTAGARGKAGETPEITTREASEEDCPEGGSEVTIGEEVIVICNGEAGEDGAAGPAGEPGAPGADGADATAGESIGVIEASLYCGAPLEDTSLLFSYNAVLFTDGTIWARADVRDVVGQVSDSKLYQAGQVGAATAAVLIVLDQAPPANGGLWRIELDREELVVQIRYTDVDVADGELNWRLDGDSANCVVNEY